MVKADFPAIAVPGTGTLYARIVTSMGTMIAKLEEEKTPNTVKNFVGLAMGTQDFADPKTGAIRSGTPYYNGTIFHRVIPNFMIQAGDPTGTGRGGPGYRFGDEFHPSLKHTGSGILSMANAGPGTNGSQFFVTEGATPHLDNRHSVFGQVVVNADLVGQIARVRTAPGDKPVQDVIMERVEIFRSETTPSA